MMHPLRIVIYGASLFLKAMAASLEQVPALSLITVPADTHLVDILRHRPAVVLYQSDDPPACLGTMLALGLCCGELNTQCSSIVIHRDQRSHETHTLVQTSDLLEALAAKE
jgi:hypothetical protein